MSRTSDLVVARLRMLGGRWEVGSAVRQQGGLGAGGADHDDAVPAPEGDSRRVPRAWLRLAGVVVALSVAFAGWSLVASWPRVAGEDRPEKLGGAQPSGSLAPLEPLGVPSPSPLLLVHVVGEVRHPGVVSVPAGSRVADVVAAAGGLRRRGDLGSTNLARTVADGERVEIGPQASVPPGGGPAQPGDAAGAGSPLDLNLATAENLDALPGIGPVTAAKILAWRAEHGRFTVVDELAEVPGIGPKTLDELRPLVRV